MGDKSGIIYMIDYGLAKLYKDPKTKHHIAIRNDKKLCGTARYASIATHKGYEQSRRDDIECLAYTLIYLAKGKLPWQGLKAINQNEKYNKILASKISISVENLCKGKDILLYV